MTIGKNKLEEEACMIRFYKTVLSWDYFQLCKDSKKTKKDSHKGKASDLKKVKDTFTDVDDYLATFEPLLFEEVKAQIVQNKEDEEDEGTSVLKQQMCMVQKCSNSDGFYFPDVIYDTAEGKSISQNDLLLLSGEIISDSGKFPSAYTYAFALVEHRQGGSLRLRMFLGGEVTGSNSQKLAFFRLRLIDPTASNPTDSDPKRVLYISKVCSLSTIIREFVAMRSVGSLPFKDVILKAADTTDSTRCAWEIPQKLMESIESSLNESQLEAIHAGLSRKPFVLIQGPPGTGKTQTILGLLNAILHSVPARMNTKDQLREMKRGPELPMEEKSRLWRLASPWLTNSNPRDEIMPVDGDDGFFPISGNELKPEVVNSSRKYRVRVLVCAPSNSALDEIVLRVLHTGVRDENDRAYNPKIVRIGLKAHHSVRAVSMDYLVEQKLAGLEGHQSSDKQKQGTVGDDRDSIRASILDEAVIVFSTLSFSGSPIFSRLNRSFDIVIIDEAAQAVEPATLVPLAAGCKQVFLVGDPKQLPATVISPLATKLGYNQSLFQRFQRAGYPVFMLKTQYRMHPEIRSFPSEEFYDNALEDGSDVEERTMREWHRYRCFGPLCFFDIEDGAESQPAGSNSWVNVDEVEFVLLMFQKLVGKYPELKSSDKMAIISPYGQQVKLFKQRFREMFGVESEKIVDINSVDGCQGRERDVVIFSCVRASKDRGIGFVADYRRMNVGITRARSSVLIVGSASTLRKDQHWGNLIERAEKREGIFHVSKPYENFFTDKSLEEKVVENFGFEEDMEEDDTNFGDVPNMDVGMADDGGADYGDGDMDMGGDED